MRLVIGAAGGTKITTAVALSIMLNIWADYNVKEAVDAYRVHHQVLYHVIVQFYRIFKGTLYLLLKINIHDKSLLVTALPNGYPIRKRFSAACSKSLAYIET